MTVNVGDKTLFIVEYTRTLTTSLYVAAATRTEAREDGEVLGGYLGNADFDDVVEDIDVYPAPSPPQSGHTYWSGGPQGKDIAWPEASA